jgi:hypothetical protein
MTQVLPLDPVIRPVTSDYKPRTAAERIVIIDARTRSVLPKRPLFSSSHFRYYAVSTSSDPHNVAQAQIGGYSLQDLSFKLPVSLTYEVRCRPGNEASAALALFNDAVAPGEMLQRAITRALVEAGSPGIPDFVRRYIADKPSLESAIASKVQNETRLDLNIRLSLDQERSLNPVVVANAHLRILVQDYDDQEQDLGFRVTLDVDDARKVDAILSYRYFQQLHEIVPREIVRFFRERVTMQAFCVELNSTALRSGLIERINGAVASFGRKVGSLRLGGTLPEIEFFYQGSHPVVCRLPEYPDPVVISNEVQMNLRNLALFKSATTEKVGPWLQKQLDEVIPEILFGVKYIDVLIRFQNYVVLIKQALVERAAAIGYEIKQLITVPDLEPLRLKEPFTIDAGGTFELRLPNFSVSLQLVITTRIPNLETVESYLNRLQNVLKLMEDAVLATARQYLHSVHPERFYMRFAFTEIKGEVAVHAELVKKVEERLEKFGAEVIDVVIKVGDTEIITRLRELQRQICPFNVNVTSLFPGETIVLKGNFQVQSVDSDGWNRFLQLSIGVDDMRSLLEQHLQAELHAIVPDGIQFRHDLGRKELEKYVATLAGRYFVEQFGLFIKITNLRRNRTSQEEEAIASVLAERRLPIARRMADLKAYEAAEDAATAEKLDRLNQLLKKRREFADETGRAADLEEIDAEIRDVMNGLKPKQLPTYEEMRLDLLAKPPRTSSLRSAVKRLETASSEPEHLIEGEAE